ncbi:MAG: hypothetical protein F4X08_01550 [Gemmatimonadetes bacterium]|nr:hypothetical protein [Gemmatimonadota bacterium]
MNSDPDEVRLVTTDIDHFWLAYDLSEGKTTEEKINIFESEYFAKGSIGLKDFIDARIESAEGLVEVIEARPRYYASIRESSNRVLDLTDQIRGYMHNWKQLYDKAVYPDVYFLIGKMTSGGTTSSNGLLIGTEISCRTDDLPTDELTEWYFEVLRPVEDIPYIVIHELMHTQQAYDYGDNTLLGQSINEGAADFLGELATGKHINPHLHVYGDAHESELWESFSKDMLQTNFDNWLYNGGRSTAERPADLGYYAGYKICEAYYEKTTDKKAAIEGILSIKNSPDALRFLKDSGYGH